MWKRRRSAAQEPRPRSYGLGLRVDLLRMSPAIVKSDRSFLLAAAGIGERRRGHGNSLQVVLRQHLVEGRQVLRLHGLPGRHRAVVLAAVVLPGGHLS